MYFNKLSRWSGSFYAPNKAVCFPLFQLLTRLHTPIKERNNVLQFLSQENIHSQKNESELARPRVKHLKSKRGQTGNLSKHVSSVPNEKNAMPQERNPALILHIWKTQPRSLRWGTVQGDNATEAQWVGRNASEENMQYPEREV